MRRAKAIIGRSMHHKPKPYQHRQGAKIIIALHRNRILSSREPKSDSTAVCQHKKTAEALQNASTKNHTAPAEQQMHHATVVKQQDLSTTVPATLTYVPDLSQT